MGNHRGARRASSRGRSERPAGATTGRRVAGRHAGPPSETAPKTSYDARAVTPDLPPVTVEIPTLFTDTTTGSLRPAVPGKRRAEKSTRSRVRGLPSMPVVVGIATLAVAAAGVLQTGGPQLVGNETPRVSAPNAASGEIGSGTYDVHGRSPVVSRDSDRDALDDASDATLVQEVEIQVKQRNKALGNLVEQAEKEAKNINSNRWSLPVDPGAYHLTSTFGEAGPYWSSGYHTGLDFAAPTGTPIMAIANGVVTSAGYEGAYGNQTIVTLEDGTEIWYCHQNSYAVSVGDNVVAGQLIGYVGSTGNTTGPHLHLEVRPGGGDPVDPFAALVVNGVNP